MQRIILVTGGAGFIGSNFLNFWSSFHQKDKLVVIDKLTYAGNYENLKSLISDSNLIFIKGDISDKDTIEDILKKYSITHIVNFAAESHVDRSISNPLEFIKTNLEGTFNLIETFKEHWLDNGCSKNWKFLHISTDEVFGSLNMNDQKFNEDSIYCPRSPYSATKAGSDHLIMAWFHTYGVPVVVSNCSNNYGPFQHPEKLIPKTIINCLLGLKIPIYGKGENIRDWLFVEDHILALENLLLEATPGSKYCIGGRNEINNIDLTYMICDILNEKLKGSEITNRKELITFVKDRPGHDFRYSIDSSKMKKDFNWEQKVSLKTGLKKTIDWYISNKKWWQSLTINH